MNCSNFVLSILALFALSFNAFANNFPASILDNAEITWAAETYTYYAPSINTFNTTKTKQELKDLYSIKGRNSFSTLKVIHDLGEDNLYEHPKSLTTLIMNLGAKTKIYKDADLKIQYTHQEYRNLLASVDTIITFDPNTFEEIIQVMVNVINPRNIQSFKVKQIIHYNAKTHQLDVTPIAIAPMNTIVKKNGTLVSSKPLFWIAIKDINEALDLNDNSIDFALRMSRSIHQDDMKVIKGEGKIGDIMSHMLDNARKNPKEVKLYHTFGQMQSLTPEEIGNVGCGIDTIITFDPTTFEEIVQVVKRGFEPKEIENIRVVQDWYWNKEEQKLSIRLLAFAPIISRFDNAGNFLNSGPMIYKRPGER